MSDPHSANPHQFTPAQIEGVYRAIYERRDMRHFIPGEIPAEQLLRFIDAAHHGPSVGFMQPWRFIRITGQDMRRQIQAHVDQERVRTAQALGERGDAFMKLKVEGIMQCAEVLIVSLMDRREEYVFGRRTMPEMDLASCACALQNFWLAARAEGIGVGWVSLFEPEFLRRLCQMPDGSKPVAILCVGQVAEFYQKPMLEREGWDTRRSLQDVCFENVWREDG
ncbi:5,6-dimethylbenzimidazole synthase [Massilia sp. W12]|uniref:5,6-dimethylbenzimidazole synthase n=1 Tax=Massilia sp. W12 TaxID=3126507 RepID=UPI0030CF4DCB